VVDDDGDGQKRGVRNNGDEITEPVQRNKILPDLALKKRKSRLSLREKLS
jgi:hypothetical protein